jgi:UDP-N-acetylglucosamine 1-carboxyvinyltransferase
MIFIFRHEDGYEIKTDIDGSTTIADAPQIYAWFIEYRFSGGNTAKGDVLIHQKMFESRLFFVDKLIDMEQNNALWSS